MQEGIFYSDAYLTTKGLTYSQATGKLKVLQTKQYYFGYMMTRLTK